MNEAAAENWQPVIDRIQRPALIVGVVGLAVALLGLFVSREAAFRSYLWAYMFWFGLPLGCLAVLMLQHLVGGGWSLLIRRILESGSRLILLMAILFIPILIGMKSIYTWTQAPTHETTATAEGEHGAPAASAAVGEEHSHGQQEHGMTGFKKLWLTPSFFILRAVIYFAIWLLMATLLNNWSSEEDRTGDPRLALRMATVAAPGIVIYALTVTGAAIDWVMSIDPHWYSTMYGVIFLVGQGLSCFAFAVAVVALLADRAPLKGLITRVLLNDLGNFLLAFTMLWAYVSFSQFLIIWSGNIAEETPYYYLRLHGGWQYMGLFIVLFHFAVPFLLLLWRRTKRNVKSLAAVAIGIIVMRWVDLYWVIVPTFLQRHSSVERMHDGDYPTVLQGLHWTAPAALVGIGGIWIAAFIWQLKRRPLVPINDARLAEIAHGH